MATHVVVLEVSQHRRWIDAKIFHSSQYTQAMPFQEVLMMVNTAVEAEVLEEKMPESPWHNKNVEAVKELLEQAVTRFPAAVVFRDLFFRFRGKQYAPDLAVVLKGAPPLEGIGLVYRVPEDGPAPDAIVEVAVSAKALGEALSEKAEFYGAMGVKDYLVIEASPEKAFWLWWCHPNLGEKPRPVSEAILESLGVQVRAEGQKVRMFDQEGNEILPPRTLIASLQEALEQNRAELRQALAALEQERKKREELERRVAELEQRRQGRA